MKKLIIIISVYVMSVLTGHAIEVQPIEAEISAGITCPAGNFHHSKKLLGANLGVELRFNLPASAWDCGLALNVTTAVYEFKEVWQDYIRKFEQSNRSINILFVGDYNFRQGKKVNPYAGAGIGVSFYEPVNNWQVYISGTTLGFQPRVGVELFRHVRIGLFSHLSRKGCNNIGLSLGVVIGGRPK